MAINLADQLSQYLLSRFPDAVVSDFILLTHGFESEIYSFQLQLSPFVPNDYILRLFTGQNAPAKLVRETTGLSLLQKAGYAVPSLLLQERDATILGGTFEILGKLEGQALWPTLATAESHPTSQLLWRFGLLLKQLHKLDWHSFMPNPGAFEKNPASLLEEVISAYRSLYAKYNLRGFLAVVDWLDLHKHEISVQPAVVHQDFHANNVFLCSNDQLYVLDWTQFAVSDFRIDLCWTLLIMGDLGNPAWRKQIFNAYASDVNCPVEQLDYFNVIVYMKLLASTVIAFTFGPEELGLRPDAITLTGEQLKVYKHLARRLRNITGCAIPELEYVLKRI